MYSSKAMEYNPKIIDQSSHAELRNAKLLYFLMAALLVIDWVLPQYFGFHIKFDFTGTRIMNILIVLYFLMNRKAGNHFLHSMLDVQVTPYLALYMLAMVLTTVFRVNVNTFFMNFLDILTFYMVYYGIRYVVGLKNAIRWMIGIAWFFAVYGLVEYVLGRSLMVKFLLTLSYNNVISSYRSGQYRIMGPCGHSIGYGLLLVLLIAVVCIDFDNDDIYLFQRPLLYSLLMINVFLTGSRLALGVAVLESVLIVFLSNRRKIRKTVLLFVGVLILFFIVEAVIIDTSVGRYIAMQIASVIDEVFGTTYAAYFGADVTWLQDSTSYRDLLPKVFEIEWLSPIIGRGADAHLAFEIDGRYIRSIDNFYVALFIRYAYPGMISYILFFIMSIFFMLKTGFQYKSGLCKALAVGVFVYCLGLWWVDYLQTTKYMYILLALYAAYYSQKKDYKNYL